MKTKLPLCVRDLPWMTAEGFIDPTKYPIDGVLQQCLDMGNAGSDAFRSGCAMLGSMASHERDEAGIFLVGLLRYHEAHLAALMTIVEHLGHFHAPCCVDALVGELRRIPSSNSCTRHIVHAKAR